MSNEWKQITREEIKRVPVGTPITVNGHEGILHNHYRSRDYGFDYSHTSTYYPFTKSYLLFKNSDWEHENTEVLVKLTEEGSCG